MLDAKIIQDLTESALSKGSPASDSSYSPTERGPNENEFLAFLKPEILALGETLQSVCDLFNAKFTEFSVRTDCASVLPYQYLQKYGLIAKHYGIINQVSHRGADALTSDGLAKLATLRDSCDYHLEVLGGHQFLDRFPYFSPEALAVMYDNLPLEKLSGGAFGADVLVGGRHLLVLDGFHPAQLEHFESPGRAIFCFVCYSSTSWKELRRDMTGATNPQRAVSGSIRRELLERRVELGLDEVTSLKNGLHLSAGPVEAAVEIARYMGDYSLQETFGPEDTSTGSIITSALGQSAAELLFENSMVENGDEVLTAFDATEECDVIELPRLLSRLRIVSG